MWYDTPQKVWLLFGRESKHPHMGACITWLVTQPFAALPSKSVRLLRKRGIWFNVYGSAA
jgi:hypothetical protein